jgi:hypothetical protein
MTSLFLALGLVLAIAAAARSTWSPCGLSMLSSLTPLAESGRGHRFRTTAAWFVVGSVLGGAALGAGASPLILVVHPLGLSPTVAVALTAVLGALAVALDLELFGLRLPIHRRQVNERWLDQYRAWVYGMGFGFQIGTGLATYIMTSALYLLVALAVLSQSITAALTLGATFGLVRGLAVLLGSSITSPETLTAFHRRFSAVGPHVRRATITTEAACAAACVIYLWPPAAVAVGVGLLAATSWWAVRRHQPPVGDPAPVTTERAETDVRTMASSRPA